MGFLSGFSKVGFLARKSWPKLKADFLEKVENPHYKIDGFTSKVHMLLSFNNCLNNIIFLVVLVNKS